MNLKTVHSLALVLIVSQLRATRRTSNRLGALRRPSAVLLIDGLAFLGAYMLTQRLTPIVTNGSHLAVQVNVDLPMFLIFVVMLSGLLWEISYSFAFTSTDMVNYLPISAAEYVLASSVSTVFSYSIFLAGGLGVALSLAQQFGLLRLWFVTAAMSLVAVFIGAFGVEMMRSFTNRASSLFYRRSGRPVLILRTIVLIAAIVSFQLAFNPRFVIIILGGVTAGAQAAWYFPLVWPSLTVVQLLGAKWVSSSLYAVLSLALTSSFYLAATKLRQIYWMTTPVSVRLPAGAYTSKTGLLRRLGLDDAESAIVRKDFRSLTRRREMARFLALPVLIVISMLIPSLMSTEEQPPLFSNVISWAFPLMLGIISFALLNSMISIGQEGHSIWSLYAAPISPRELVRAKVGANLILTLPVAGAFWLGVTLLGHQSLKTSTAFLLILIATSLVESLVGVMVGLRFPDFNETIRSRFIRIPGMLLGMLIGAIAEGILLVPYGFYLFLEVTSMNRDAYFILASLVTVGLATLTSNIAYRYCLSRAKRLLQEIPV